MFYFIVTILSITLVFMLYCVKRRLKDERAKQEERATQEQMKQNYEEKQSQPIRFTASIEFRMIDKFMEGNATVGKKNENNTHKCDAGREGYKGESNSGIDNEDEIEVGDDNNHK